MKKFLRIAAAALACCLLAGCGEQKKPVEGGEQPGENPAVPQNTVTPKSLGTVEGTTHVWKETPTSSYIAKDGQSGYSILISAEKQSDVYLSLAAADLKSLIEEATGAVLPIVTDEGTLSGKYLAVGETALSENAGLGATAEALGSGGYIIRTVGESVVMTGATDEASMYAVYGFLEHELGYDNLFTEFYTLERGVDLPLKQYDVIDIPDFEYRIQSAGWIRYYDRNRKRMRWTEENSMFIPADGNTAIWHNTFTYLPKNTYKSRHPEWYSTAGNQVCYTARGDAQSRELMLDTVLEKMITLFKDERFRSRQWITFSIEDNQQMCTCEECSAEKAKYGADSAVIVKFLNELAERCENWFDSDEGRPYKRDRFRLFFFAYHAANAAPVTYDEATDTYAPVDDSVVCRDDVVCYFAETNGDYTQNFTDRGTANTVVGDNLRAWAAVSKEIYLWSYSTNFNYFLTPYNSFDGVQDIYKYAKRLGCVYMMTQDQWVQTNAQTGWGIYKNWLHGKLGWDVNADVNALTDEFFEGFYGPAAKEMRTVFDSWRVWARHQTNDLGYSGARSVYTNVLRSEFWPQQMLESWLEGFDRAYAAVEPLKETNTTLYNAYREHILFETLGYRYLLLELYNDRYEPTKLAEMKKSFLDDIDLVGLGFMKAGTTLASVFSGWTF